MDRKKALEFARKKQWQYARHYQTERLISLTSYEDLEEMADWDNLVECLGLGKELRDTGFFVLAIILAMTVLTWLLTTL